MTRLLTARTHKHARDLALAKHRLVCVRRERKRDWEMCYVAVDMSSVQEREVSVRGGLRVGNIWTKHKDKWVPLRLDW